MQVFYEERPEAVKLPLPIKKSQTNFMSGLGVPGQWWIWKVPGGSVVFVCCPKCRLLVDISEGHTIAKDGLVKPEVSCKTGYCNWSDIVKLEDWNSSVVEEQACPVK